jgi:hypothetical protein
MKPVVLHSAAAAEVEETIEFYDSRRLGLGEEFETAVQAHLGRIARRPKSFGLYKGRFRKCLMDRPFRYVIYLR